MNASQYLREAYIAKNRKEYGKAFDFLNWANEEQLSQFAETRNALLKSLLKKAASGYSDTKIDVRNLSPGCRICAEGKWSCLFINGECNCKCFYCPTSQDELGIPATNALSFPQVEEYLAYLGQFGFKGVSISGGEPFLTFDRSLAYLSAIRKRFDSFYLWMYTNGTRVTEDQLKKLRDAGLNEIRFDIGATGYQLKYLKKAIGIIPAVTVEIPAVPEDFEKMKAVMKNLKETGVNYLNLHQLRLTPYNINKLAYRPYTFLNGEKVTVIESELTALKLLKYNLDENINLPVNYCSFVYKNRYQHRGARVQTAWHIIPAYGTITPNGYIRQLYLTGNTQELILQAESFKNDGISNELFHFSEQEEKIYIHPTLKKHVKSPRLNFNLVYKEAYILPFQTYHGEAREKDLGSGKKIFVGQKKVFEETNIEPGVISFIENPEISHLNNDGIQDAVIEKIFQYEQIQPGLQEYL